MNKRTYKSKRWFLQDTIDFYNYDNRGVVDGGCVYKQGNKMCAIGRYLLIKEDYDSYFNVSELLDEYPELFPAWMKKFPSYFLTQVQRLHDTCRYWTEEGLSEQGKQRVLDICKRWNIKGIKFKNN